MEPAVVIALSVFGVFTLIAVLMGIVAAISAVSGFEKPEDRD